MTFIKRKGGFMRSYFHFSPERIRRRTGKILIFSAVFCAELCVAAFFVLIFNFLTARNYDVILRVTVVICAIILTGMLFCLCLSQLSRRKIRRSSRYTYVDIQQKAVIFSSYGGEYRTGGRKIIVRDLWYIPFEKLKGIEQTDKGTVINGEIRHFSMNSENLGYHIKDGDVVFDREWLNTGGFEKVTSVRIPAVFGKKDGVYRALVENYRLYLETPKPRPYVFREADFIRRRAKPRVMPEDFGYSRKW